MSDARAPGRVQAGAHVVAKGERIVLGGLGAEHHVRPARRTIPPAWRGPGLQDHRPALRAARDGERASHGYERPGMVGAADLRRVREGAGRLVEHQRILVPAIPQREASLEHVIGPVVAPVLRRQARHAGVARLGVAGRGDDVPGGPALAQQVERAERPGDLVGLVERGGDAAAQAQMRRRPRHQREHDHWVDQAHLPTPGNVVGEPALIDVGQAQRVGEEQRVEPRLPPAAAPRPRIGSRPRCRAATRSGDARRSRSWRLAPSSDRRRDASCGKRQPCRVRMQQSCPAIGLRKAGAARGARDRRPGPPRRRSGGRYRRGWRGAGLRRHRPRNPPAR